MRSLPICFLLVLGVVAAPSAAAAPIDLGLDAPRFWYGGQVESGDVSDPGLCDVVAPCPSFELDVPAGGARLRVAYDTPSREDSFELRLEAPDGTVTSEDGSNVFNAEAFVTEPAAGRWTVQLVPKGATRAFVRLRAKVERDVSAQSEGGRLLLPNLRAVPPYEFGFAAPANPLNAAYPPDTVNPPLSAAGQEPASCAPDELAPVEAGGGGAHDCLRLTTGPINVGDGPFLKVFTFLSDASSGSLETAPPFLRGDARQVIVRSDGTTIERPAGTYSFHTTHAHFHDEGILTYELFRVVGDDLAPAGEGTKSGFCPADQLMGQWRLFAQDPSGTFGDGDTATGSCYGAADDGLLSLTRGWGDVYRWQRPGQYVEFAGNGDGYYVARATVDKGDTTLETDETDNASYALIRVSGRRIELLERGQGLSHRDPHKIVFSGFGPASQDPFGGLPPDDPAPPAAAEPAAAQPAPARDVTPPRVDRLRMHGRSLRFAVSEPATVRLTLLRGERVLRRMTISARAGANSVRLPRLRRGRYRIAASAVDAAGNRAKIVTTRARV